MRRMFEAIGHPVTRLKRVRFGELGLLNLQRGKFRHLSPKEAVSYTHLTLPTILRV